MRHITCIKFVLEFIGGQLWDGKRAYFMEFFYLIHVIGVNLSIILFFIFGLFFAFLERLEK